MNVFLPKDEINNYRLPFRHHARLCIFIVRTLKMIKATEGPLGGISSVATLGSVVGKEDTLSSPLLGSFGWSNNETNVRQMHKRK